MARNHPQTGINLTYLGSSGSIGAGGDQYVGLDQFGRIADQNWVNNSTGQSTDNFTYAYDQNSNVTAENNLLDSAYSQAFTYDQLNRLASVTRGGAAYQSWNLDSQGNWSNFTSNGSTQTRTANAQNQITSATGTLVQPTYDANGNVTGLTDQLAGNETLIYDAWNRLVAVKNSSGQVIAQYTYNAQGYRVTETYPLGGPGIPAPAGTTKYLYYSTQEQVIEERWGSIGSAQVQYQYVWSASYVNAMILRDTYNNGVMLPADRLYTQYDANYNVTALVGYDATTQTWGVVERFAYSAYGTVTPLAPGWFTQSDQFYWQYMYQGGRQDPLTQLYHFDHREYSASLGTWTSQDPLQYINGANTYQFVVGNPVNAADPSGLSLVTAPPPVAPPFVEPWTMPTGPQGPGWEPFNAPEFFPGPSPEPGLTPVPEGAGSFLDFINPWAAVLTPLFDTTPAGGNGDTIQAPWPYNLPGNQEPKTGPQVQASPDGGARRNPKTEDGNPGDVPTNPGGGGKKPPGGKAVASPGGDLPPWPGKDPTKAPPGTEWRGQPGSTPGNGKGSYYNPNTGESFHPDLNHPDPIGPHWDYVAPDGSEYRIMPDGTVVPK